MFRTLLLLAPLSLGIATFANAATFDVFTAGTTVALG